MSTEPVSLEQYEQQLRDLLGLAVGFGQKDLKDAYYKAALKSHPDKDSSPEAEKNFIAINEAYEFLSKLPVQRKKEYDDAHSNNASENYNNNEQHQEFKQMLERLLVIKSFLDNYSNLWDNKGKASIGRKFPDGIERMNNVFTSIQYLNVNYFSSADHQDIAIAQMELDKILKEKINPYSGLGKRDNFVQNFYSDSYNYLNKHTMEPYIAKLNFIKIFKDKIDNVIKNYKPTGLGFFRNFEQHYKNLLKAQKILNEKAAENFGKSVDEFKEYQADRIYKKMFEIFGENVVNQFINYDYQVNKECEFNYKHKGEAQNFFSENPDHQASNTRTIKS